MKFGSFHFADSNTPLHVDMLERHLYDMIPNAWKLLGNTMAPPPIPKQAPSKVTPARRMTKMPVPIVNGGLLTRMMAVKQEPVDINEFDNSTAETIETEMQPSTNFLNSEQGKQQDLFIHS